MNVIDFVCSFRPRKITPVFVISSIFFLLFMSLDFFTTTWVAQGDIGMEGNPIARWWWETTGPFHHIDVPIWVVYVLGLGWVLHMKSEFLALWWINAIGFGHVLGWLTWLPYNQVIDYLYVAADSFLPTSFVNHLPLGAFGILFGIVLAMTQIRIKEMAMKRA